MIALSSRRWVFERGLLYGLDAEGALPTIQPRLPARFCEIGPESVEALTIAMGPRDARDIPSRLARRRRCFATWVGNQIASYGWVSQTDECIGEQERGIALQPHEAYIWDCATLPQFRNQGLYSALLSHIAAALKEEGVRRVWIGSSSRNRASLRGFVSAGFQPALALIYCRCFGLRLLWTVARSRSLGMAARRALMTEQERTRGMFLIHWSAPMPAPCADEAEAKAV